MTTVVELNSLVQDSKRSEKELQKSLYLEIRLQKLTFTNVKMTCPLFRQQKLSIELKRKNLKSLISTQLDLQVKADMNDLKVAITECSENVETDQLKPITAFIMITVKWKKMVHANSKQNQLATY